MLSYLTTTQLNLATAITKLLGMCMCEAIIACSVVYGQ